MTAASPEPQASAPAAVPWYLVMAHLVGALTAAYGVFLAVTSWLSWLQLEPQINVIGPPSYVQLAFLTIEEGAYLAVFGAILAACAYLLARRAYGPVPVPLRSASRDAWRTRLVVAATLLVAVVVVLNVIPAPLRIVTFEPADFRPAPSSADGPYETYYVSPPFPASAGEDVNAYTTLTLRDNATGAVVTQENFSTNYVKAESAPYAIPQWASGMVAASTAMYVVVARNELCENLATPPCENATVEIAGNVWITTPTAYVLPSLLLGSLGSALAAVFVVQSGLGRRRTTS